MAAIYHVLNRGVDKRNIFLDDHDRLRFVHDLFAFNDQESTFNSRYTFRNYVIARRNLAESVRSAHKTRKLLVNIHAFCLMDNHYHLLLSPLVERGVSLFMKKINMGYARYFNTRYERAGALFEGRYKSVLVDNNAHLLHLPFYIHLNPLDFKFIEWRRREISDYNRALKYLESYRWSSHLDYLGKKNFSSVTQRDFLLDFFGGCERYKKDIQNWLKNLDFGSVVEVCLE